MESRCGWAGPAGAAVLSRAMSSLGPRADSAAATDAPKRQPPAAKKVVSLGEELVVWRVLLLDPLGELLPQRLEIVLGADALLDLVAAGPDVLNAALVHVLLLLQSEEMRFEVVNLSFDLLLALLPPLVHLFIVEARIAQSLLVLLCAKERLVRPGPFHVHDLLLVIQPRELPPHQRRLFNIPR